MNLKLYKHLKYTIYKQSLLKLNNKKILHL